MSSETQLRDELHVTRNDGKKHITEVQLNLRCDQDSQDGMKNMISKNKRYKQYTNPCIDHSYNSLLYSVSRNTNMKRDMEQMSKVQTRATKMIMKYQGLELPSRAQQMWTNSIGQKKTKLRLIRLSLVMNWARFTELTSRNVNQGHACIHYTI